MEKNWKNKILNLVSISNQGRISKSNTAPKIIGILTIDRNSKEHSQNRVNQK